MKLFFNAPENGRLAEMQVSDVHKPGGSFYDLPRQPGPLFAAKPATFVTIPPARQYLVKTS